MSNMVRRIIERKQEQIWDLRNEQSNAPLSKRAYYQAKIMKLQAEIKALGG